MQILSKATLGLSALLAAFVLIGAADNIWAQGNSQWAHEKNRIRKEQKAIEKEQKHSYRLYRGANYYETDQRGVDLIRRAVQNGYQQGYRAGTNDRRYSRRDYYFDEPYYRSGTYGYQAYVDREQYKYYYREGFERGYRDGYSDEAKYGTYSGGKWSILTTVLNEILNLRKP